MKEKCENIARETQWAQILATSAFLLPSNLNAIIQVVHQIWVSCRFVTEPQKANSNLFVRVPRKWQQTQSVNINVWPIGWKCSLLMNACPGLSFCYHGNLRFRGTEEMCAFSSHKTHPPACYSLQWILIGLVSILWKLGPHLYFVITGQQLTFKENWLLFSFWGELIETQVVQKFLIDVAVTYAFSGVLWLKCLYLEKFNSLN